MTTTSKNILTFVLILSFSIELTYTIGFTFGKFYRSRLHSHVKEYVAFIINRFIDFAILSGEGARVVYTNREEYLTQLNKFRHHVGSYFVYSYTPSI